MAKKPGTQALLRTVSVTLESPVIAAGQALMILLAKWCMMICRQPVRWKHQTTSLTKFIRMLIGGSGVITKECPLIAPNATNANLGWVTEQWVLMAKAF